MRMSGRQVGLEVGVDKGKNELLVVSDTQSGKCRVVPSGRGSAGRGGLGWGWGPGAVGGWAGGGGAGSGAREHAYTYIYTYMYTFTCMYMYICIRRLSLCTYIWVVVKIMVPFGVPIIIRHLLFRA